MAHVLRQVRVRGELEWLAAAQLMRRFVGYIWVRRILEGWIGASQGKEVYLNGSNGSSDFGPDRDERGMGAEVH
jgi:hypothetical protein